MRSFIVDENQVEQIEGMTNDYPYVMTETNLTDFVVPWHWHEELELGYIERGTSKIITLNGEYMIHQGDGFFINKNVMDMKENAEPGEETLEINHIFHPVFLGGYHRSRFETKFLAPIINNRQVEVHVIRRGHPVSNQILNNLARLRRVQAEEDSEFQTRNILSDTWLLLREELRENFKAADEGSYSQQDRVRTMLSYIHRNYGEKLAIPDIADAVGVSEREVTRSFRRYLNQSPTEYILSYRLNEAKRLLAEGDLNITEITFKCGFSDSAYFGKQFRKMVGTTPTAYRREKQEHGSKPTFIDKSQ